MVKKYKNSIFIVFVLVSLIISITSLYVNKIFYLSYYHYQIEVSLNGTNNNGIQNILNKSSSFANVARIDRITRNIYFEHTDISSVNSQLTSETKDLKDISFKSTEILARNTSANFFKLISELIFIIFASLFGSLFVLSLRFNDVLTIRKYLRISYSLLLPTILTFIFELGLMSLVSRIYQIKEIDVITLVISQIILMVYLFSQFYNLKSSRFSLEESIIEFNRNVNKTTKWILITSIAIFILLGFATGINFIMTFFFIIISEVYIFISLKFSNVFYTETERVLTKEEADNISTTKPSKAPQLNDKSKEDKKSKKQKKLYRR